MPALAPLPIARNETPHIGGDGESLVVFLAPINDPWIQGRIGVETVIPRKSDAHGLVVTQGERYRNPQGGAVQGRRYLWTLTDGVVIGALNISLATEPGRRKPMAIVSNIYVHPEHRRQGIASSLIKEARHDFPQLTLDTALTIQGASFFLGSPEGPTPSGSTLSHLTLPSLPTLDVEDPLPTPVPRSRRAPR